ncbi:unnamed protein product, partial [Prorocentrum cordatum]
QQQELSAASSVRLCIVAHGAAAETAGGCRWPLRAVPRRRRRRRRRRPRTGPPGRRSRTPRRSPGAKAPVGLRGARGRQPRGRSTASATCGSCCEGVARAWLGGRCFFGRAARSACGGALPSVGCQLLALYSRLHLITMFDVCWRGYLPCCPPDLGAVAAAASCSFVMNYFSARLAR